MCKESATADDVHDAMPHPVVGSAADPIALEPVDDVVVTTLVDNVYDALLTSDGHWNAIAGGNDHASPRARRLPADRLVAGRLNPPGSRSVSGNHCSSSATVRTSAT